MPGNVCEDDTQPAGTQVEKIVIISADLARLDAAPRILKCFKWRHHLGKEARLDLTRNFHFVGCAAVCFHPLRHLFREANIFKSDARLAGHRIQQMPVLARIGLFREALSKSEHADQVAIAV